ncbi:carboxylesterase family protein [Neobacillus drentensis]|uniref:carboxylesterase/lipase family protein n=1 Tax=Neobacillus drentensis TaxID=220684 RepID=UPI001F2F18D8|nr:carboxylesterase family protein [Neobacillus drentensis]ULT59011.1 carboxylesterase family protein [Neobacillus drentensis]
MDLANTKYGSISGIKQNGYTVFKGIPYAKPPIGELRFCAPEETAPWDGVYEADTFQNKCIQSELPKEISFYIKEFYSNSQFMVEGSEDGLFLNIWTPAKETSEKLPVAFWIHGGGFLGGFGSEMEFDGKSFCKQGVILVTINYRLGLFGFLAHEWLCKENEKGVSGNYGILDQIMALKWVYENIEAFGGDPENITVFGQSAGAVSVQTLISSKLTGNMIKKAIMQSGGGYQSPITRNTKLEDAKKIGKEFLNFANIKSLKELREISAEELLAKVESYYSHRRETGEEANLFFPIIDCYVLENEYDKLIEKGEIKDIPYMLGCCKDDISVTSKGGESSSLYRGCIGFSHKLEELGRNPAYVYYFTRDLPGDESGAFHSGELWYMFGTLKRNWRPNLAADYDLSGRMVSAWTNFIKFGDPNINNNEWTPYSLNDPYVKAFDID